MEAAQVITATTIAIFTEDIIYQEISSFDI
jgi:hypothetical protein